MKKSLFCLYAFALILVTGCRCNSSSEREDTASAEEVINVVAAAPDRVYARDRRTDNVKGYHMHQDVATVIEDYYRNFVDYRADIGKDGKIKKYTFFSSESQFSFGVDGTLLSNKYSSYDDGVLKSYSLNEYDDKHRVILREVTFPGDPTPATIQYIFEDDGNVTYATVNKTNAYSPSVPRYKYAEYDKNHRLIRLYAEGGEIVKEEWKETSDSEIHITYKSGVPFRKSVYDDKGRRTEYWVKKDNVMSLNETVQYDDANWIQTFTYPNDNDKYQTVRYHTEDYAYITKSYNKNRSGEITYHETNNYDAKGNVIRSVRQYDTVHNSYEYDSKGNWIVKVVTISSDSYSPSGIYIRHIRYHDGYDSDKDLNDVLCKYVAGNASSTGNISQGNNSQNSQPAVIEHHGAVQVWIPCEACNNSGQCQICHGTGRSIMRGDPCITCGGNKKCTFCAGNGGHYEMRSY